MSTTLLDARRVSSLGPPSHSAGLDLLDLYAPSLQFYISLLPARPRALSITHVYDGCIKKGRKSGPVWIVVKFQRSSSSTSRAEFTSCALHICMQHRAFQSPWICDESNFQSVWPDLHRHCTGNPSSNVDSPKGRDSSARISTPCHPNPDRFIILYSHSTYRIDRLCLHRTPAVASMVY